VETGGVINQIEILNIKEGSNMEQAPKYPVGLQRFSEIREGGFVYVDKTDLVYKLTHDTKFIFLSRPRRFGKTLLTNTLQCYFEGRKELFNGLSIERLEQEWKQYPVLHFDFSGFKGSTVQALRVSLGLMLADYEHIYGANPKEISPGQRFSGLIKRAYEKTGQPVALLIDEYDGPMLEVLHLPEQVREVRETMREFFSQIKRNDQYFRFVFLTGISTFSQLGMFSELNNLKNISNRKDYATICGITLQELKDYFQYGIRQFTEAEECSQEEILEKLKDQYDGYHFTNGMTGLFNPFSLLSAFDELEMKNYWFQTGTPAFVIEMLKQHKGEWKFELEDIDGSMPLALESFCTPLEQATGPMPFLYQAGYLTIKDYDKSEDLYVLGVPNTEVRVGLLKNLIPLYSAMNPDEALSNVKRISAAFNKGEYDRALSLVQSFLAGIPFMAGDKEILNNQQLLEAYYHRQLYIIFSMLHNGARAQVRQAVGMPDILIETSKYIYIIEVKFNASPEKALQQIEEKHYDAPYLTDGREIVKLGVNFSKETRTLESWRRGE
jgi:hypothetical protein